MERAGADVIATLVQRVLRAIVPYAFLPLALVASVLAAAPWLRSFPASLAGAPLYGAALISVLLPIVVVRIKPGWLWPSVLADIAAFVLYALVIVVRSPTDISALGNGLIHGPSEILTFALPLVSPRSLMVAPAAVIWLAGTVAGECVARRWYTTLPYVGFLVSFGIAYAATQRAAGLDAGAARARETALAGALLATLLLMRAAQAWVRQDETAESTQPEGILPLRGLIVGIAAALVIAMVSSVAVQSAAFPKHAHTPQRIPSVDQSRPLTPLSFIAGLRPRTPKQPGRPVFTVSTDKPTQGYFAIANVDFYDGAGWSFTTRTFRPSGGVLPADTDPALRTTGVLTQQYRIADGPLANAPWLPLVYRAQRVDGTAVDIDPASGMIVPAGKLPAGASYSVTSSPIAKTFDQIKARTASPDTATPTINTQLPGSLRTILDRLVHSFSQETGTPAAPALPFLQSLQQDLRTKYTLSGAAQGSASGAVGTPTPTTPSATPSATPKSGAEPSGKRSSSKPSSSPNRPSRSVSPSPSPSSSTPSDAAGGTSFADVLASILGPSRFGTPEQFATLIALVARDLGVPARVTTGFRVEPEDGSGKLARGRYDVTTADAWTWAEVPINGAGWVVLDSAPARFSNANKPTESGAPPPSSSAAPPSQNALITQGNAGHAVAPNSRVPHTSITSTHALLVAVLVALALLVLVILVVLLTRKPLRAARRRRAPDPRAGVIGAWRESLDVLAEAGMPDLSTLTSHEVAALTIEQFGSDAGAGAAALGAAANAVTYSTSTRIDAADAEAAWAQHRALRKIVYRRLGVRGRLAAALHYHRSGHTVSPVSPDSWAYADAERHAVVRSRRARARAATQTRNQRRRYEGRRRSH